MINSADPGPVEDVETTGEVANENTTQISAMAQVPGNARGGDTKGSLQVRDRVVYGKYLRSIGMLHSTLFVCGIVVWAVVYKFSG